MHDFRLLGDRVRTTLVSWQQRALATVSEQMSIWPAQLAPLRTRLAPLRTPEGRLALWRSAFPLLGFTAAYLVAYMYGNGLPSPAPLWPPDALLLSALLLAPPRRWRLYLLSILPIRMLPVLAPGVPPWLLIVNWLNDTLTILLAAVLVR